MNCLYCDNRQNHVQVLTTESIISESAPQIKALDRNLSAFSTLFAPGKSWDNVRSTTAPYTESRLAHLVRNKCVGFPVVEQVICTQKVYSYCHLLLKLLYIVGKSSFLKEFFLEYANYMLFCQVSLAFYGFLEFFKHINNDDLNFHCRTSSL